MCAVNWEQFLVRTNRNVLLIHSHIMSQLVVTFIIGRPFKKPRDTRIRLGTRTTLNKSEKVHIAIELLVPRVAIIYKNKRVII